MVNTQAGFGSTMVNSPSVIARLRKRTQAVIARLTPKRTQAVIAGLTRKLPDIFSQQALFD